MKELSINEVIPLQGGGKARVKAELGRGGQGIVYLVDVHGKMMALKWYHQHKSEQFRNNIRNLVDYGPPMGDAFLWPRYSTQLIEGHFGYVMDLRPEGYYEFGQYLLNRQRFGSVFAMIQAAMRICDGFQKLHLKGYSYRDLNDGNFFIHPSSGDVLICDNDNVGLDGEHSEIKGKPGYMAPEVVCGGHPDTRSDRFSLAVILFFLFMRGHPLEGKWASSCPCLTEKFERLIYGEKPVFVYDPDNENNRPDPDVHRNVARCWGLYPERLREQFQKEFSKDCLDHPEKRCVEMEWKNVIEHIRDNLVNCPHCGEEIFFNPECKCPECGKPIQPEFFGKIRARKIPFFADKLLFFDNDNTPDAEIKIIDGQMRIVNLSPTAWKATGTDGKSTILMPNQALPLKDATVIESTIHDIDYKLRVIKTTT